MGVTWLLLVLPLLAAEPAAAEAVCYWIHVLVLLGASGAVGGILAVCSLLDVRAVLRVDDTPLPKFSPARLTSALLLGSLGGAGGAVGFSTVLVLDGKLDAPPTEKAKIMLCGVGVAAGFVGFRLLKRLASRLDDQIAESERRTDQKIERETTLVAQFAEAVNSASYALNKSATDEQVAQTREEAIAKLEAIRKHFPEQRQIGIFLGRLLRRVGRMDQAIKVLTEVIDTRRQKSLLDQDTADLLFNRACYYNLKANSATDESNREHLRQRAWEDLKASILLSPTNLDDARADQDLQGLEQAGIRSLDSLRH